MKPTRKSIGDKDGYRSVYVVEVKRGYRDPEWFFYRYASSYLNACKLKEEVYQEYKKALKKWKREDFRISLYGRAE